MENTNKNAIEVSIKGIKCDNPICDFADMSVDYTDYENWVNRPCPKCGQNLLTEKDFKKCKRIKKLVNFANRFCKVDDTKNVKESKITIF